MSITEKCPHCGAKQKQFACEPWLHNVSIDLECCTRVRADGTVVFRGVQCYEAEIAKLKIDNGDLLKANLSFARVQALYVLEQRRREAEIATLRAELNALIEKIETGEV